MRASLAVDTIERIRAPLVENAYGDLERDWDAAETVELTGWRIDPSSGFEQHDTIRDAAVTVWRLYGPLDADVAESDRVVAHGDTWEVDEHPQRFRSPRGNVGHTVLVLKRVEG